MPTHSKQIGVVDHERVSRSKSANRSQHVEVVLARIFARQRGAGTVCWWCRMKFEDFPFGRIRVDGAVYDHDLVIDHEIAHKRKKTAI